MGASLVDVEPAFFEDEVFASQRAVSRLHEMASKEYAEECDRARQSSVTTL
jgi:predicted ATPase